MAYLSHLPQLLAVALMTAAGEACGEAGLGVAGRAFREMTRLASSPPDVWRRHPRDQRRFRRRGAGRLRAQAAAWRRALERGRSTAAFTDAQKWRARLPHTPPRRLA